MSVLVDFTKRRHSVSKLVVHLVFTTKYRVKLLDNKRLDDIETGMRRACESLECEILEFNGESDHVHVLVQYPPKLSISVMVNNLKSVSSRYARWLNSDMRTLSTQGKLWSRSYFASSAGGVTIETLKNYVQSQSRPD